EGFKDMRKIQLSAVVALSALLLSITTQAFAQSFVAPPNPMTLVDNAVNVIYDPASGGLSMVATGNGSNGQPLKVTTLELLSAGGFNTAGVDPSFGGGAFDVATADKLFILRAGAQAVGEQVIGSV